MDAAPRPVREYVRAVVRRRWAVLVMLSATVLGAMAATQLQDPIYESTAEILVEPRVNSGLFDETPEPFAQNLDRRIQTEVRLIEGEQVRARVRDRLRLPTLPPRASAEPAGATDVVNVTVRSGDARTAQALAIAYVDAYVALRREQAQSALERARVQVDAQVQALQDEIDALEGDVLDTPDPLVSRQLEALVNQQSVLNERVGQLSIDAALTTGGVSYIRSADLPDEPVLPTPRRTLLLACIAGLLLGVAIALLLDHFDESVRTAEDVEAAGGPPVLAAVPVTHQRTARPVVLATPFAAAAESYRALHTNVTFAGLDRTLRTIQVTSALPNEGKTTTACNLAAVLAQAGSRVVLIDADLRKPRVHDVFGIDVLPGLTTTLLGAPLGGALRTVADNLDVVPAGRLPGNSAELMAGDRFAALLRSLAEEYEYVVVDSPPILPVADSIAIAGAVDGVLLVVEVGRLNRRALTGAVGRLEQVGVRPFGVVLNQASKHDTGAYGYGYDYDGATSDSSRQDQRVATT